MHDRKNKYVLTSVQQTNNNQRNKMLLWTAFHINIIQLLHGYLPHRLRPHTAAPGSALLCHCVFVLNLYCVFEVLMNALKHKTHSLIPTQMYTVPITLHIQFYDLSYIDGHSTSGATDAFGNTTGKVGALSWRVSFMP